MNRLADYIFFEPTTRYHLLQSILNKKIINIYRNFKDEVELNEIREDIVSRKKKVQDAFCFTLANYTIEFEENISIDIARISNTVSVRHSSRYGYKWQSGVFTRKPARWSIKEDLFRDWEIAQILGQKITNISFFLAKITRGASKYLSLELSDNSKLVFGNMDGDFFGDFLFVSKNNSILEKIEKKEYSLEHPNIDYELVEDYWADSSELVDNEYIELYYTHDSFSSFSINTDIYWEKLSQKPIENYITLNILRNTIFEFQMGIVDLRFGISKEGELKLVKPIDLCVKRILDDNIFFIQALMDTIYKHVPEKIEKYYLE